jgi:hypothetical protein
MATRTSGNCRLQGRANRGAIDLNVITTDRLDPVEYPDYDVGQRVKFHLDLFAIVLSAKRAASGMIDTGARCQYLMAASGMLMESMRLNIDLHISLCCIAVNN